MVWWRNDYWRCATLFLRHFEPLSRVMQYGLVAQRLLGGEEQPAGGRLPMLF
jgi:hypothetical protein